MAQQLGKHNKKLYKVVLTGGPCGGKTTGQSRLCTFFENIGWKVYRVPETATVLVSGGIKFSDMTDEEVYRFQLNLLKTMIQIEDTYFELAEGSQQNCLVICDRGCMDATAYLKPGQWDRMKAEFGWNEVDLRDRRYNQVIHMMSAAMGAQAFYHTKDHATRYEGLEMAKQLDELTSHAWVGHPYYEVIDNSTDFDRKVTRLVASVACRLGLETGDRLAPGSKKRKFLIKCLPNDKDMERDVQMSHLGGVDEAGIAMNNVYPQFQDFIVVHDYLVTPNQKQQARIRRRGQNVRWDEEKKCWDLDTGNWSYTHTIRLPEINQESPELKMQITSREYKLLRAQCDSSRFSVFKKRRCFLWHSQYFQMDIYQEPCHSRCVGLVLLETYTTQLDSELDLPEFLQVDHEVTDDSQYSMYNLSIRELPQKTKPTRSRKDSTSQTHETMMNGVL